ncbi:MAG: ATPase, T2SS/T4P/T4SS family [Kofleriaceae bacterium]
MFTILIQEKGGEQRRMVFNKPEVTIGRVQGNDIVLPKGNVSKRHARIVLKDGKFIIVDLKSTNGTYVNGRKITSPLVVKDSDKIYIGDFIVGVDENAGAEGDGASETTTSPPSDRLGGMSDRVAQASPASPVEPRPEPRPEVRPPRPTEAQVPPPSSEPAAAIAPPTVRPGPPRPAPGPGPLAREPAMPPLSAPPPPDRRSPPLAPRHQSGTMPPPLAPIPPPMGPPPSSIPATEANNPPLGGGHGPSSQAIAAPPPAVIAAPPPMVAAMPAPNAAPPPMGQPAPVVPLSAEKKRPSVKRVVSRSVAAPSRRGAQIEPLDSKVVKMLDLQSTILERLRAKLDLDKIPVERLHDEELWQRAERATIDLAEALETSGELPKYIDQDALIKETLNEALALGPLEDLLADEKIDEIFIDRRDRVVVGKDGQLRGSGRAFSSDEVFERVVKRLVAEAGATIDEAHPIVDLRMRDGTRLTAAISPVAARGACIVLKKAASQMPSLADLTSRNTMSRGMSDFLSTCITARRNILVCGGPGSGKTTVLAALAGAAPSGERVVSVEEVGELSLGRDEWVPLETRAGVGKNVEVDLGALLETALRLTPDRLVVGEVRGREAAALITALSSSTDGAIVGMTADGSTGALSRLATLTRAMVPGSEHAIRELVTQAFDIVVHVARWPDGAIKIMAIEEIVGCSETTFDTQVVFQFQNGAFAATGTVPRFYSELEARGIPADQAVFR